MPRWDCPTIVSRKTTTEKKDLSPAPRARWGFVREVSPYSSQLGRCPIGRGAAAFGVGVRALQRLYLPLSAPRGVCEKSPHLWAELPFAPRRGAAALALKCALPFPTMSLPRSHWRRCVVLRLSPTNDWDSPPRAGPCGRLRRAFGTFPPLRSGASAERVAMRVLPVCLDLSLRSAGRSPFKVLVKPRFSASPK